ncbi:MAG: hypothetical protein ACREGR_00420, partial [Minisyncoccia bacterium]
MTQEKTKQAALQPTPTTAGTRKSLHNLVFQKMIGKSVLTTVDGEPQKLEGKLIVPAAIPDMLPPQIPTDDWPKHWPKCPEHIDRREWKRACENRDYYEYKALEASQPGKYWFNFPKEELQYSELVYLTPEMMDDLLKRMPVNRDEDPEWIEGICRDVKNQRWMQTSESLDINTLGNFQNGRHRAEGVKLAGTGWVFYVTWNVPPQSILVTDTGKRRGANQQIQLVYDSEMSQKTAALCRAMMGGLENHGTTYTPAEIVDFAVQYKEVVGWATKLLGTRKKERAYRADVQAVVAKAYLYYGKDAIEPFAQRLSSCNWEGDGDPVKTLYFWIQGARKAHQPGIVYYK